MAQTALDPVSIPFLVGFRLGHPLQIRRPRPIVSFGNAYGSLTILGFPIKESDPLRIWDSGAVNRCVDSSNP
jgi:hypothetical protein